MRLKEIHAEQVAATLHVKEIHAEAMATGGKCGNKASKSGSKLTCCISAFSSMSLKIPQPRAQNYIQQHRYPSLSIHYQKSFL